MNKNLRIFSYVTLTFFTILFACLTIGLFSYFLIYWLILGGDIHHQTLELHKLSINVFYWCLPMIGGGALLTIFYAFGCEYLKRSKEYNPYFLLVLTIFSGILPCLIALIAAISQKSTTTKTSKEKSKRKLRS